MINELASILNDQIKAVSSTAFDMLSALGKRMFFPNRGILSQSAEAKKFAKKFNATIGTALEDGHAMNLDCVMKSLPGFSPNDALLYAPSSGLPALRKAWKAKILHDNPSLENVGTSLPVVTNGLSHALSIICDMFVDAGDSVLVPDMNWDNYLLNLAERTQAKLSFFPFFCEKGFNIEGFRHAMNAFDAGQKVLVILNFPNNPSGYTPLNFEGKAIADILLENAERGVRIVALVDDAYYGLFYDPECMTQSIFSQIAGRHERLLAVKADAATKECYVWGLRIGFVTFAVKDVPEGSPMYAALEAKAAGIVRATISNVSALSQRVVTSALESPDFYEQRGLKAAVMKERFMVVAATLGEHPEYAEYFTAYPFNSGYFMCIRIKGGNAEGLRHLLLEKYETGGIAITNENFRLAFSCLEKEQIPEMFEIIYKACRELHGK